MPSLRTSTHIVLLCVTLTTVYLSTVEGLIIFTKDASHSDFDQEDVTLLLLKQLQPEQRYKQKQNDIKALGKLLDQITDKQYVKRNLREDSFGSVKDFLSKLNTYINKNTQNNDYKKRDNCRAFGPPGSICKKNKFRRILSFGKPLERGRKEKNDNLNYGQHMLVERARYRSSSESSSDEDRPRKKSRFQIVNNAKYKKNSKGRQKESPEEQNYDDDTIEMANTDDSDEDSDEPEGNVEDNDNDAESDEPKNKVSDDSYENSVEQEADKKVFYLQGSRLQKPYFKSRYIKPDRRNFRESHFMPKRYKWDDNMLTHLDEYWTVGIKSYDTHRQKYEKLWPYRYYK